MRKIDFNLNFQGFNNNEKILVDTGIILALANEYDSWHNTVKNLFEQYVINEDDKPIFLFINPTILNEITFLAGKPFESYKRKHPEIDLKEVNPLELIDLTVDKVKELIKNDVLQVASGNKNTVIKQLEVFKELGSADAVNASIADHYNLSFLTVDNRLVNNMFKIRSKLRGVPRVYFTSSKHQSY
ncbi:hypothetical protein FZC78_02860 [Rossellomorea vietnamensis]|uniref:Uncharacterized protein n=1 Tax=Rossellomorea vietnamensis TaxID=218284 RepID=A0A5D4NYN7_9BACI|nr:PIN domain-containing protein [Rossellomorea vietnamensis]TYS18496.1 hypothetical protein FZC78_02860 [Rossellomorea vietnamensis]